jgi:hypothetical protein
MSKGSKISGLFFIALLLFLSIRSGNYGLLLTSQLQSNQTESSDSYFSMGKLDLAFLNRPEERTGSSVENLPIPSLKNHLAHFNCDLLCLEKRIFSVSSGYLSHSIRLYRSLTNVEIIYPFHSHW